VEQPPLERRAVRAVVIDAAERVLLVRFRHPDGTAFWTTPGGGLELGEADLDGLRRELAEEIGLSDADIGPCVWTREHVFVWRRTIRQLERIYLVRVDRLVEMPTVDLAEEDVDTLRWWTIDELAATDEVLAPRRLVPALQELLAGRIPERPYDVGI
jgi:ADP-ribose pyrophosphatase YjhB (NUDIX family)